MLRNCNSTASCCLQQGSHLLVGPPFSTFSFMLIYNLTLRNIFKILESLKFHVYLMIKLIYNDLGKKKILCRSNYTTKNDLCNRRKMTYVTVSSHPPVSDFVYYLKMRHLAKKKKKNGTFNLPSTPSPKKNTLSIGISIYGGK